MITLPLACVQLSSQDDMDANLRAIEKYARAAAKKGAKLIALPENAFFMQAPGKGQSPAPERGVARCRALARELHLWMLLGSVHEPEREGKSLNRSLLIDAKGNVLAHYDKIHLFDVTLGKGEAYRESDRFVGGTDAVLAHTPWGAAGMTVCYDVRFATLYRTLAQAGANMLFVPSAFTYTTGKAHWHTLLRARAIETGCWVIAPAQCGMHPGKRRTFGHSLMVSPWGKIVAEGAEDKPGIIMATLDMDEVSAARAMIPSLRHDRAFGLKSY